jgi:hypothetical protein
MDVKVTFMSLHLALGKSPQETEGRQVQSARCRKKRFSRTELRFACCLALLSPFIECNTVNKQNTSSVYISRDLLSVIRLKLPQLLRDVQTIQDSRCASFVSYVGLYTKLRDPSTTSLVLNLNSW